MKRNLIICTMAFAFAGSVSPQCGIIPIKPIPPIGCKDLRPECQCDSNGRNCKWVWICVRG